MQVPDLVTELEIGQPPEDISSLVRRPYPSVTSLYMKVQFVVLKLYVI
jgi:hypothetical protein